MPVYTFHLFSPTGVAMTLDLAELPHDGATFARCGDLLIEHLSCDYVEVWEGERAVVARHRHQPIIRPLEASEQRR